METNLSDFKNLERKLFPNCNWEFWLCRVWLPLGLFIQLSGFFWLPSTHHYKVVVANCLLLGAVFSLFNSIAWQKVFQLKLFPLLILYLIYMSAIPLIRHNEGPLDCLHRSFYIALYVFALGFRIQLSIVEMRRLFFLCATICAAAIIYGLGYDILYRHLWSDTYRFTGYASLYNPLRSGHLFGFFHVVALWLLVTENKSSWSRWLAGAVTLICLLGVVFTGSRAPLIGLAIAGFYLIYFATSSHTRKKNLLILTAILTALYLCFWQQLTERGLSLRPQIWAEVIKQWYLHPWLGAGYNAPLNIRLNLIDDTFFDTHNIVLAVLYYGGLIGLFLFFCLHTASFVHASRWRKFSSEAVLASALMIYGLVTLQFDGGSIIGRPNEFWLLLWFPIAFLLFIRRTAMFNNANTRN